MTLVITLFAVGVLLVAIEVIVPGGVLGILGGIALLAGVVTSFVQFGVAGGSLATGVALLIGALTIYLEFVLLPKTRLARKFSLAETVAGTSQPPPADRDAVLGRECVAVTTLAPSGYVELDGKRYEAFCRSGYAEMGTPLRIVDLDTFRLVVTKLSATS